MERWSYCPVCRTRNLRTTYRSEVCLEEEYYDCETCSYFYIMSYSEPIEGIVEGFPDEYKERVIALHLRIYEKEFREHLPM